MHIKIMGREKALAHVPQEKTYGIRIGFSGSFSERCNAEEFQRLENHPLYVPHVYHFDDVEPSTCEAYELPITKEIAVKIIRDFEKRKEDCFTLLVHCEEGQSRSPAVAMALNHIFKLEYSNRELAAKYPRFNIHVVQTIVEAGRERGYCD